jgi:hypothetical protein
LNVLKYASASNTGCHLVRDMSSIVRVRKRVGIPKL